VECLIGQVILERTHNTRCCELGAFFAYTIAFQVDLVFSAAAINIRLPSQFTLVDLFNEFISNSVLRLVFCAGSK